MWETTAETHVAAPPSAVWALWRDAARWPEWNDQIAGARLLGRFEQGTPALIRFRRAPRALRFTITELEDGRRFVDETRLPGARLGHDHRAEPAAGGTRVVHRLFLDGPAERLWAFVLGRTLRSTVRTFGEHERRLAEAAGAT